ncbi:MAG: hypothetical protein RIN55_12500 [Tissierellaceae bacterium]|nr:hypothetical protein [Tissierellaceae bacterium]
MKIRILGWKYENIRRMGDVNVNLCKDNGEVHAVSLVMMPNGTGKTTTITLMRGVLSGKAINWDEKMVKSFSPKESDCKNGKFQLVVSFDNRINYYILHLDYEMGTASIQTSFPGGQGGLNDGWRTHSLLKGIMDNEEFVNRFLFDGEQARKTLSTGNEEAERAIIYLYQINKLDEMISEISDLIKFKQENSVGANTSRSIKVLRTKVEKREEKLKELQSDLYKYRKQLEEKRGKKDSYIIKYDKIIKEDEQFRVRKESFEDAWQKKQEELGQVIAKVLAASKRPYNIHLEFHRRLKELVSNMQVLRLPKSTAREFFRELAVGKECICKRCIGPEEKKAILDNAEKYLGQEELVALNAIKSSLREYELTEELKELLLRLDDLNVEIQELGLERNRIEAEVSINGSKEIIEIQSVISRLEQDVENLMIKINLLDTKDFILNTGLDRDTNIHLAKKSWEEANEAYLKASGTYEFTKKAETAQKYLNQIKSKALNKLKENIILKTNNKVSRIISNDEIVISKIDRHLVLKGREAVSEGQTLAIAYAYIGSLFEHSYFEFPFVVDSPAAAMDLNVRREVAEVIPRLFKQLIIFVTSGEVKGFAETFYEKEDVQYLTLKGEKNEAIECILGKDFFSQYQSEKEGA